MRILYIFIACLIGFFPANMLSAQPTVTPAETLPGRLVFKLKPEFRSAVRADQARHQTLANTLEALAVTRVFQKYPHSSPPPEGLEGAVDITLIYQIDFNPKTDVNKARQSLMKTGLLEYAEPIHSYPTLYLPTDPLADSVATTRQYHLKNIQAYRGWDFDKGDTSIVIGVLDTGVKYSHHDLKGNLKYNYADPIDGIDNDNDGYIDNFRGWDMAENDNDASYYPFGDHGVGVIGVASATTDNRKGIAGVGFKCKYLPVKVYANTTNGVSAHYEGIVYAADHGCHVINLSWGGYAPYSQYEQDIINYAAINKNIVMVASAGNTNGKLDFYPASYKNVLSVGAVNAQNVRPSPYTYGYQLDVVAPGVSIRTTGSAHDSVYVQASGSSFASPMVAGAAGLVKSRFPNFNALQIAEQLRVTADAGIYAIAGNASFQNMLGKGLLNIKKALSTTNAKSVRFTNISPNQEGVLYPGDTLKLTVDFKNFLAPLSNLNVTISSPSSYVTITQGTFNAGAMPTLGTVSTSVPFKIFLAPNTPVNEKIAIRFDFTDGTYTDFQYHEFFANPDYVTLHVNQLAVTLNSKGNLGYNSMNPEQGNSVRYKGLNLLAEGGLMVGTSPTAVSDNIRNARKAPDFDFFSQTAVHFVNLLPRADQMVQGLMQDSFPVSGMAGVQVAYSAYAWQAAPHDKYVVLEYKLKNIQTDTLTNLYAGIFAEWDIFDFNKNIALWNAAHKLGYVYNIRRDSVYAGIKLLSAGAPSYYAIDNVNPVPGTINITDGFTDAEKYQALAGGVAKPQAGNLVFGNDVSTVTGVQLPALAPNAETTAVFALIAGDNLNDLLASAQAAQNRFDGITGTKNPLILAGARIYPNPATATLQVEIPALRTETRLEIIDMLGKTVGSQTIKPGVTASFDVSGLAPGLYIVKSRDGSLGGGRKIQISK